MTIKMNEGEIDYLINELGKWKVKLQAFVDGKDLKDFYSTVGLEFCQFLEDHQTIGKEFYKRAEYFKNLSKDQEYRKLEEKTIATAVQMVETLAQEPGLLAEAEGHFNNKFQYSLKQTDEAFFPERWYSLTEYSDRAKNTKNYYRLGDTDGLYGGDEPSFLFKVNPVRNQFPNIKRFISNVCALTSQKASKELLLEKVMPVYNLQMFNLQEKLYNIPRQLHIISFEKVFLIKISAKPHDGNSYCY